MPRRKQSSPMPWRDAITPRTVKDLGALAGCMALASGFLLWVEPKMQLYGSEAEVVLPAEVRALAAKPHWDGIYVAAAATPADSGFATVRPAAGLEALSNAAENANTSIARTFDGGPRFPAWSVIRA